MMIFSQLRKLMQQKIAIY